jgi:hypothetical protein
LSNFSGVMRSMNVVVLGKNWLLLDGQMLLRRNA